MLQVRHSNHQQPPSHKRIPAHRLLRNLRIKLQGQVLQHADGRFNDQRRRRGVELRNDCSAGHHARAHRLVVGGDRVLRRRHRVSFRAQGRGRAGGGV